MDTATLTAAEVIDGVRAAQRKEHEGAVEQLQLAVRWALIHPCRDEFPAGWEDDHGIFTAGAARAPLAGAGAPLADEEEELARRGVWLRHRGNPATTDVVMTLDTPDAFLLDQTVGRIAGELRELGDSDQLDVRRARAVGILADPQYALDLLSGRDA